MYATAFARPPTQVELESALAFLHAQRSGYGSSEQKDTDADNKTWSDLCHVLFNVKEFIFIN